MRLNMLLFRNTVSIYKSEQYFEPKFFIKKKKNFFKKELCDVIDYIIGIKMFITL